MVNKHFRPVRYIAKLDIQHIKIMVSSDEYTQICIISIKQMSISVLGALECQLKVCC